MDFDFYINSYEQLHFHQDIELFYVVEGSVELTIEQDTFSMEQDDFIIINANKKHGYTMKEEALICCIHISYQMLNQLLKTNLLLFWCNSVIDKNEAYEEIRRIIRQMLNQYFEKKDRGMIYLNSLYYELLHVVTSNFLMSSSDKRFFSEKKDKYDNRLDEIINYLRANYNRPISLNDLADKLYLSNSYLSKYIKKQLGMSFIDYLNKERLHHAMEELLYTDHSITRISLDNGFANAAAFNKAFKEAYHTTPSVYQAERKNKSELRGGGQSEKKKKLIEKRIQNYYEKNPVKQEVTANLGERFVIVDSAKGESYSQNWNRMINIGEAGALLSSDIQEHVLILKKELDFTYIRFWDLWGKDMYMDINDPGGNYNFDKIVRVLDFLVSNKLKPYLELGFKPKALLKSVSNVLIMEKSSVVFDSLAECRKFMPAFMSHVMNRYGIEEVETWYFELWKDEYDGKEASHYFDMFDMTYEIVKSFSHKIKFGGAGLSPRFGMKNFYEILEGWEKRKNHPDFLSLYLYPYVPVEEGAENFTKQSTDSKYVQNQLIMANQVLEELNFKVKELHVSEWNLTVSQRNIMNDSCYKGAYIMKNTIESIGLADVMGYWIGSDCYGDYYDSKAFLNGSGGILSKNGIRKPAFYAFDFLNHMGELLLKKEDNCMVTTNGHYDYFIACHNYKHFNYQYYMKAEDELDIRKQHRMFVDNENMRLNFQINNVKNGTYRIITHMINQECGSVQDEWMRMDFYEHMHQKEIEYLNRVCTPRIFMRTCVAKEGVLNLEAILEPNEIQLIQVVYQY
ncbi:Beta-xylosidase [Anaerobium acetethylicum]|uniref:Beta-xylosidase n=2 Tax=Anaerobium acetethylicum TaxID=1619234 RepID=A0A1D3TW84_9FIRM|nr:Beta-xylosidase [Anaerobium acetethylicum]